MLDKRISGSNSITLEGMENGDYYAKTTFFDDRSLEQNNKIRNSGMLDKSSLGLHDNADIRCAISCPSSLQWSIFRKKHFDTYKLLTSVDSEKDRMKGVKQLEILHPDWIVFSRK